MKWNLEKIFEKLISHANSRMIELIKFRLPSRNLNIAWCPIWSFTGCKEKRIVNNYNHS